MPKKINLNKYTSTADKADCDLIIEPIAVDGEKQPCLYFISNMRSEDVVDVTDAKWIEGVRVASKGTREEYNERVTWWFDNVSKEYKDKITSIYKSKVTDLMSSINEAKGWLKGCQTSKRKHNIQSFLEGWLRRESRRYSK